MPDFVDATIQDLDRRLGEMHDEQRRLEAARAALVGPTGRGPGRPRHTNTASSGTSTTTASPARATNVGSATGRRPGRPRGRRGSNTRSNQVLALIRKTPGITIPQLAEQLKIQPNYLYRVIPKLNSDGLVIKDGTGLHPVAETSPTAD
jgi:hypothetical protein